MRWIFLIFIDTAIVHYGRHSWQCKLICASKWLSLKSFSHKTKENKSKFDVLILFGKVMCLK